jgi:hypothetical protein
MGIFSVNAPIRQRIRPTAHRGEISAGGTMKAMANLVMVYGMRLLPADEIAKVDDAPIELKNGNQASVTMHVLEGSREQIEAQLRLSIDAFFDFYPER